MSSETYIIDSQYKAVNEVSESVKEFCLKNGLSDEQSNDIIICLIEALK